MIKRMTIAVALMLPLGIVTVCAQNPADASKGRVTYEVLRVVDGDTLVIDLDGHQATLRVFGVDAPELKSSDAALRKVADEAHRFAAAQLAGKRVYLDYETRKSDRYGRLVAYVFEGSKGTFFDLEMIKQGYGRAHFVKEECKHAEVLLAAEREAREAAKGLWALQPKGTEGSLVFVTKSGAKYHRADCRFVRDHKISLSWRQAKEHRYEPCRVCKPEADPEKNIPK